MTALSELDWPVEKNYTVLKLFFDLPGFLRAQASREVRATMEQ
jgi:hypothetical protein